MNIRGLLGLPLVLALGGLTACAAEPGPDAPGEMALPPTGEQVAGSPDIAAAERMSSAQTPGDPGYRAMGNEPFWNFTFGESTIDFHQLAADSFTVAVPEAESIPDGWRFTTTANDAPFIIEIAETRCNDTMSGRPFPHTVTVTVDGRTVRGCGGDTESLLTGGEWEVMSLEGDETGGAQRPTLLFAAGGELTGTGGCNRFRSEYVITGEGITFSPAVATRMACAEPEGNAQETRFFALLEDVSRFDITEDGWLALYVGDEPVIVAQP